MNKYSSENISRIGNAAIYIAQHASGVSKTKLLKLLYLMEERSALRYHQPFLGLPYEVWQAGPVAKDIYIDISDGVVMLSPYVKVISDKDSQYIEPVKPFDEDDFSVNEIRLMDEVLAEYGNKTAKELVAITHRKGTLWYNLAKEKGLLEAFEKHECNNSSYVINFADAMSPCSAEHYEEALALHNASNLYSL
jgi:uncharacterized phage-associated protein